MYYNIRNDEKRKPFYSHINVITTYAWFTMNKEVSVTGMTVEATASEGLVISGDNKGTWKTDWDVAMPNGVALYPTSTDGAINPSWAVAYSDEFDNAKKNQAVANYLDITPTYDATAASGTAFVASFDGVGKATPSGGSENNYVLKKTFFIKSTNTNGAWNQKLILDEVTATASPGGASGSALLNRALRVLVVMNGESQIYAPVSSYDGTISFKNTTDISSKIKASSEDFDAGITSIPNNDAEAIRVDMYIYYEGEDQECKSSNITGISVDTLTISAKFVTDDVTP